VTIDYHCEHCGKAIQAPQSATGRNGKCPHCQAVSYIPLPEADGGELSLVPLDDGDERRRRQASAEDIAVRKRLLADKSSPRDSGGRPKFRRPDVPGGSSSPSAKAGLSRKRLTSVVVSFVEAMSGGKLDVANKLAAQLTGQKAEVSRLLDELMGEDLSGYGLPALPKPVLMGFLKQLRGRL